MWKLNLCLWNCLIMLLPIWTKKARSNSRSIRSFYSTTNNVSSLRIHNMWSQYGICYKPGHQWGQYSRCLVCWHHSQKFGMIWDHIWSHNICLMLVANNGPKVTSIKLFDTNMVDFQKLYFMISNLWDLEPQLYRLWIEVAGLLKDYIV